MPNKDLVPFENTPYSDPLYPGIDPPLSDPFEQPTLCLEYNYEWRPVLTALASRLLRQDAWTGDVAGKKAAIQKAHELIAMLQKAECPEGLPDGLCTEFMPENPFTTYFPQNPFTQPEFVPPGYTFPPFYTNVTNILLGIVPTDVATDILHFPINLTLPELIGFSFPTIHIELEGTGECELHFLKLLQGGFVTVTIDGNPLTAKIIDLNALSLTDFTSILAAIGIIFGGGLSNEHIEEIEFTTSGEHTIDIVFYPHIGGSAIIGFGGALRAIHFCDTTIDGDMRYMPITDIRVNIETCKWQAEYNNDGIWVDIGDYWIEECVVNPVIPPQTNVRQTNCQLEQSFDGGINYVAIGNPMYRLDAFCPADLFYAKSDTARLKLETAAGLEQFRAGFKAGDATRAEITTPNRDLEIRGGFSNQIMFFNAAEQTINISNIQPDSAGIKSAFQVQARNAAHQTYKANGRTDQTGALFAAYNTFNNASSGDMFTGNSTGKGFTFSVRYDGSMRNTLFHEKFAYRSNGAIQLASRHEVLLGNAGNSPFSGREKFQLYDNGVLRTALDIEAISGAPRIGFLGAEPIIRQPLSGDAQGNQLLFDLAAILASYGLVDVTGITLGLNCCDSAIGCRHYSFRDFPYNSDWNIIDGQWVATTGYFPQASQVAIRLNMSIDPDIELKELQLQGDNTTEFDGVYVKVELDGVIIHEVTLSPTPVWSTGIFFINQPEIGALIEIEIITDPDNPATLTDIEIQYLEHGGEPSGGEICVP